MRLPCRGRLLGFRLLHRQRRGQRRVVLQAITGPYSCACTVVAARAGRPRASAVETGTAKIIGRTAVPASFSIIVMGTFPGCRNGYPCFLH